MAASVRWLDMMMLQQKLKDFIVFLLTLRHLCENKFYCSIFQEKNTWENQIGAHIFLFR